MTPEQIAELKALIEKLGKLIEEQKSATGEEFAKYQKKIEDLEGRIRDLQAKGRAFSLGGKPQGRETIGTRFVNSEVFKAAQSKNQPEVTFATTVDPVLSTDGDGNIGVPIRDVTEVVSKEYESVESTITPYRVSTGAVSYIRETGFTSGAGVVTQGNAANPSELTYEAKQELLKRIETWIPIHEDAYNDSEALRSIIDEDLMDAVQDKVDETIINAILNDELVQVYDPDEDGEAGDTVIDAIRRAKAKADVAKARTDILYINPVDTARIDLVKGADGQYVLGGVNGAKDLWGLRVFPTNACPEGKFIIGSTKKAKFVKNGEFIIEMSKSHGENFTKSMLVIKATRRGLPIVTRPEAWVVGEFPEPVADGGDDENPDA